MTMLETLKNLFIPHKGNDHRPHILRPVTIAVICLVALLIEGAFLLGVSYLGPRSELFGTVLVSSLADGTNAARQSSGLSSLRISPLLQAAAQEKANDMVQNGYFAHTSPAGVTPWYWFENVGYSFSYAGENLAVNFSDSNDVTNAWLNSPEHRANILNANFKEIGIATAQGTYEGHDAVYVVELFGTPSSVLSQTAGSAVALSQKPKSAILKKSQDVAPLIVSQSGISAAEPNQTIAAVKGVETQTVPMVGAPIFVTTSGVATTSSVQNTSVGSEANFIQQFAANPRQTLNDFYLFVALFFGFALALNIFIKIRIQHPNVIMGGIVAISVVGIFILLNQQMVAGVVIK
jgi:hypothetical protein